MAGLEIRNMASELDLLFFAPLHSFYLSNGDFESDYCDTVYGSELFFILYYKMYDQTYCSVAKKPNPQFPTDLFFDFPMSEPGGWIKGRRIIERKLVFDHFLPYFIFTKRIKGKNLILLDGSSKHNTDSGSSSLNTGKTI